MEYLYNHSVSILQPFLLNAIAPYPIFDGGCCKNRIFVTLLPEPVPHSLRNPIPSRVCCIHSSELSFQSDSILKQNCALERPISADL